MDPELKAALSGLKRGTPEYQKAFDKFMANKAKTQGEAEERKAKAEREARREAAEDARKESDRKAKEEAEKTAAKAARDRQTSLITAGSSAGGLAAGLLGGYAADRYGSAKAEKVLTGRSEGARNLAAAARAIDPTQPAARMRYGEIATAADKSGVLRPRVVPIGGLGVAGALGGMGAYSTWHRAPQAQSDEERALWTGTGYGELGAGAKMLASSAHRYMNPGVQLPPEAIADIEFARKQGAGSGPIGGYSQAAPQAQPQAGAPSATAPTKEPTHSQRLIAAARAAGASGKLNKQDAAKYLVRNVTDTNRKAVADALGIKAGPNYATRIKSTVKDMAKRRGGYILPIMAGAAAYDAVTSQAEAAGDENAKGRGALAGLTAAGVTAAVPYAISKLPATLGRAISAGGPSMAPGGIDMMTDYSPEELMHGRNMLARYLPSWARAGAVEDAYQMSQVPERSPFSQGRTQFNDGSDFDSALNDVLSYLEPAQQ